MSQGIAAPASVTVSNHSRTTACAEEDNVSLHLQAPASRAPARRGAAAPYLDRVDRDVTTPDFSGCNFDGGAHPTDPAYRFREAPWSCCTTARDGASSGSRCRPSGARSGCRCASASARCAASICCRCSRRPATPSPREVLVLYPADGYWRIKPVPAPRFGDGVYGSSFLLGPVVDDGRPVVNIASIRIETRPLVLRLRFADGGQARVAVVEASRARERWTCRCASVASRDTVRHLRSMHVAPDNADASEIRWRQDANAALQVQPLETVAAHRGDRRALRPQRPSRGTSAPDLRYRDFEAAGR